MVSLAGDGAFKDVPSEWHEGTAATSHTNSSVAPNFVDWNNRNYPPLLRLMHYDIKELPKRMARIVRLMHIASLVAAVVLILNLINVTILALVYERSGYNILYSALVLLVGIPGFTYIFYIGYRTLARTLGTGNFRAVCYICLQLVGLFFASYFLISDNGPFNGLKSFSDRMVFRQPYVMVAAICESLLWLIVILLGFVTLFQTWCYNPFSQNDARTVEPSAARV